MNSYSYFIFGIIGFLASIIGSICGIGGGILIKPILDTFAILSVSSISFLSGCTVLAMTCYSVLKAKISKESLIDMKTGTPLAIGAAIGGLVGKMIFQVILNMFTDKDKVGAIQAICLLIITLGSLLYTLNKNNIKTYLVTNYFACLVIGLFLGISSSFLGIGGGPINLVVLFYFFSMDTKVAAQNSLYIILYSQVASLLNTLLTGTLPDFDLLLLILMAAGGILGGVFGRKINQKIDVYFVNKLFVTLMCFIMIICVYNIKQFM